MQRTVSREVVAEVEDEEGGTSSKAGTLMATTANIP